MSFRKRNNPVNFETGSRFEIQLFKDNIRKPLALKEDHPKEKIRDSFLSLRARAKFHPAKVAAASGLSEVYRTIIKLSILIRSHQYLG